MVKKLRSFFTHFLVILLMYVGYTQSVQAALIGTDQVTAAATAQDNRAHVSSVLNRPEIQAELEKFGIDKADAQARVAALSDEEVASVAHRLDELPAAGMSVAGGLVLIFVILLVTDVIGWTHIFPFTSSARR